MHATTPPRPLGIRRLAMIGFTLALIAAGVGCQDKHYLMPTPLVYTGESIDPFETLPPELAGPDISVLYVTDRAPTPTSGDGVTYGTGRSRSLAAGEATVRIGRDATWEEIANASRTARRGASLEVVLAETRETIRFPKEPATMVISDTQLEHDHPTATDPAAVAAEQRFLDELRERLALTPRKEVFVYVHGFNNTFEDGVLMTAELWHFLGREGVPVCYTWPAGLGMLRAYEYTLASTEFTVHNFKKTLRLIASCEDVERINILAHSRGTQVTTDTIRELYIEAKHLDDPRATLKLGTVILAAADIDLDVMVARNANERIGRATDRVVMYLSQRDNALGLSDWLFGGRSRVGNLDPTMFTPVEIDTLRGSQRLQLIKAEVTVRKSERHSYFHDSPAVSSDIVLIMRYGLPPGANNGRPLGVTDTGLWDITDGYPGKDWTLPPNAAPQTPDGP